MIVSYSDRLMPSFQSIMIVNSYTEIDNHLRKSLRTFMDHLDDINDIEAFDFFDIFFNS